MSAGLNIDSSRTANSPYFLVVLSIYSLSKPLVSEPSKNVIRCFSFSARPFFDSLFFSLPKILTLERDDLQNSIKVSTYFSFLTSL